MLRSVRRFCSSSAATSAKSAEEPVYGRKLLNLLFPLGNYGVGARVTRTSWSRPDECYWVISKIKYNKNLVEEDGSLLHGKVWGTLYWGNKVIGRESRRVPGHMKKRWKVLEGPPPRDEERPPLTKRLHKKYYVIVP